VEPSLLEIRRVSRRFGGVSALTDLSFRVGEGELLGLIGPNGSGKTTIFNVVTGVYAPTQGDVVFRNRTISGLPSYAIIKMGIARTFQNIRMFKRLTVLENVLVGAHLHHRVPLAYALARAPSFAAEERRFRREARELLNIFGLVQREDEISNALSYATQRRVEIARALATRPTLLLLDEPSAGMNPQEQEQIKELIRLIKEEFQLTIILVEHNLRVVMDLCPRIVAMDFGQVIAEGPPGEIQRNQKVIEAYLGVETG
jgi:branched-chain amino acid transport system ATP-binding protein